MEAVQQASSLVERFLKANFDVAAKSIGDL
jgi:hypothetical protein